MAKYSGQIFTAWVLFRLAYTCTNTSSFFNWVLPMSRSSNRLLLPVTQS